MSRFISPALSSLAHYTPGEQPSDSKSAAKPAPIKLNTNESPYPPAPGVLAALGKRELQKLNLYPNPDGTELVAKIATIYDIPPENVILGNGSDELLAFSFLAFFSGGVSFPDVTYGFYPVYANLYNTPYTQIPLTDNLTVNIDDYINVDGNVVLANPNAPTGIALKLDDIKAIVAKSSNRLVLVDEAYVDFGAASALPLTKEFDNLLVIHTFSKARSMAGARLAYAIAAKPIIDDLNKMKYSFNPYNVNRLTQTLGLAALEEDSYYKEKQREIVETRNYSASRLAGLGFELTDSKANFLFARNARIGGEQLYLKLKGKNILVRHWNLPRISDYVRITIGTRAQMDALFTAVEEILEEEHN